MAPVTTVPTLGSVGIKRLDVALVPSVPATEPVWRQLELVVAANYKSDVKEIEWRGDDQRVGTFYWGASGTVSAKLTGLNFQSLEFLSGVSGGSNAELGDYVFVGSTNEYTPPKVMLRATIPAKTRATGAMKTITVIWFDCDVKTLWDGIPAGEDGKLMEVPIQFNTYHSTKDEKGNDLPASVGAVFARMSVK